MTKRSWFIFIFTVAVVFIIFEVHAMRSGGMTLSQVVWSFNDRAPVFGYVLTFAVGVVAGHWFWPRRG